jgi:hypothetical protein
VGLYAALAVYIAVARAVFDVAPDVVTIVAVVFWLGLTAASWLVSWLWPRCTTKSRDRLARRQLPEVRHSAEGDLLHADEVQQLELVALDFEAQLDGLTQADDELVERLRPRVAAVEPRDRADVSPPPPAR